MLKIIYLLLFSFIVLGSNTQVEAQELTKGRILFVVSNALHYGQSEIPASNHFSELVYPYDVLSKAGYQIDIVSPEGGPVPIGYFDSSEKLIMQYMYDCAFMSKLSATLMPEEVNASSYSAIYYNGGGSAMFGIAENEAINEIAMIIYEKNEGIISAVCHGSFGIANLQKADGSYLIAGKKVNGFPDIFENKTANYFKEFSNSVEGILTERGALFNYSEKGWDGYYQVDGRLITGQDPSSAAQVAKLIIEVLEQ